MNGTPLDLTARLLATEELEYQLRLTCWLLDGAEREWTPGQLGYLVWQRDTYTAERDRRQRTGKHPPSRSFGFNRDQIDRIKHALPIEQVIGVDVELRKVGQSYRGCCPLHGGHNPSSLSVAPGTDGFWHCHSCGLGGDVLQWMELFFRADFAEALQLLAIRAGEPFPFEERSRPPSPARPAAGFEFQGGRLR